MKEGHLFIIIFLWFEINICFNANSNNSALFNLYFGNVFVRNWILICRARFIILNFDKKFKPSWKRKKTDFTG